MAQNPAVVSCSEDAWTVVATNVTSGLLHKLSNLPGIYKQTYRLNAQAAPTDDTDAIAIFLDGQPHEISSDAGIDVYIKCIGAAGSVRLDL